MEHTGAIHLHSSSNEGPGRMRPALRTTKETVKPQNDLRSAVARHCKKNNETASSVCVWTTTIQMRTTMHMGRNPITHRRTRPEARNRYMQKSKYRKINL